MATQRHYYQPTAYPYHHAPSKAPAPAPLYPISRVSGSPPDFSDASTTAGSRSSGGLTFSSAGEYDSSFASYSGVDVVDVLSDRMQDAFDPTPLDKGLARQAQTSGQLNAKQQELLELQALAQRRLKGARANFTEGLKTARETKRDLEWTQKRVRGFRSAGRAWHVHVDQRACGISADEGVSRRLTHVAGNSALKAKAEKAHPDEYRRSSRKYAYDGY
ncbi:domain KxDL [Penicillium coprophilum]|uniref:domain KxDL n=1 Tax=Penicillium coprophilum TaxID=36646 RepID=UPI0023946252|nr:domain KxDL [Penicillium coprophilum]KAJ5158505.1 domain KxDL [Penicillium coprophilum]